MILTGRAVASPRGVRFQAIPSLYRNRGTGTAVPEPRETSPRRETEPYSACVTVTSDQIAAGLRAAVPFNSTIGVEYGSITETSAVLTLPDRPELHNHIGGPHAGAMFSLGEAASGTVVIAAFGHLLSQATPLAAKAEIRYRRVAMGDVTAEARLGRDRDEVAAELEAGGTPKFPVEVTIRDADGATTGEMTVSWALRPNRT